MFELGAQVRLENSKHDGNAGVRSSGFLGVLPLRFEMLAMSAS